MPVSSPTTLLAPQSGTAVQLHRGDTLAIIDTTGGQVADLAFFSAADVLESFSPGRTIDYLERIKLRVGDALYSQRSNELAMVTRDDVGVNDMLLAPCSQAMFAKRGVARTVRHRRPRDCCDAQRVYGRACRCRRMRNDPSTTFARRRSFRTARATRPHRWNHGVFVRADQRRTVQSNRLRSDSTNVTDPIWV
jgi:hypothetical protein